MKIDLEFVELHSPLFIDGMNFGLKLYADPKKSKAPISMYYDTDLRHTIVLYKNKVSMIESTAGATLKDPTQLGFAPKAPAAISFVKNAQETAMNVTRAQASGPEKVIRTAQVSTPHSQTPKTILRRPKYQGEESQGE
jgi:hypothetical protein